MLRFFTGIFFALSLSLQSATWTDCSREFDSIEILTQTVTVPSPAEIDYKAGLGKEFREALAGRTDIDWKAVQDHYREWSEHTTTLSGPARMLVACVLSVITQGMGTFEWLAGHGIAEGTATNAALSSGIQTLAASAGTALAANLGDLSKAFDELTSAAALKNFASTMLTAGISQSVSTSLQLPDEPKTFTDSLKTNTAHGLVRTGVDSAINGGKVGKNLAQTLTTSAVDAGSAQVVHTIGDAKATGLNKTVGQLAHAGAGALKEQLKGGDPLAGAIGAVVAETAAEIMDKPSATPKERRQIAQKARIIGDTVAFVAGRDVASADSAGATALENNFLEHLPEIDAQRALAKMMLSEEDAAPLLEILDDAEQRAIEAAKDPIVNTVALSAVGMGIPFVAKTAAVVGTAATAHYYGSIAVDSGVAGLKQEAKDHPILTTMAVMPFVPGPKVLKAVKGKTEGKSYTLTPYGGPGGGHHIHMKSAYKSEPRYNPKEALCLSNEEMERLGINHLKVSVEQRRLCQELQKAGKPMTREEQNRIAVQSLQAGGASEQMARDIVARSQWDLKNKAIRQPTDMPYAPKIKENK